MKTLVIIIMTSLFVSSCNSNLSEEAKIVKGHYKSAGITFEEGLKYCLVIPEGGCGGCIDYSISFLRNNLDRFSLTHKDVLVVFTAVKSQKLLNRSLGYIDFDKYNFMIDVDDKFLLNWENNIYPMVLYLSKGEIQNVCIQSPDNSSAIDDLNIML